MLGALKLKPIKELIALRCRVALVTAGTGHVGSAIMKTLAELGAKVAVGRLGSAGRSEIFRSGGEIG